MEAEISCVEFAVNFVFYIFCYYDGYIVVLQFYFDILVYVYFFASFALQNLIFC